MSVFTGPVQTYETGLLFYVSIKTGGTVTADCHSSSKKNCRTPALQGGTIFSLYSKPWDKRRRFVRFFVLLSFAVCETVVHNLVERSSLVGELWHPANNNDTAREFVRHVQILALVVMQRKEC